ncbi:MAG TPA: PEGA domain-containing protein, partial [Candidatus Nanopelagicales bacterium]|nr:PEGA domain-containing protein [Candidatus Nanopelagicales bacterium]
EAFVAQAPPRLKAKVPALDTLVAEVRAKVSRLTVESPVDGARVLLDHKVIGETPLPPLRVNAGSALIEVEAEGYHPFRKQVELPGGGEASVTATLTLRSSIGVLVVRSPVAGATVVLDGRPIGVVPAEASVRAGTHTIRLARDGYEDASTTAILRAGERKEVSIPLERTRPLVARWWFWTGIGVAVVGGAVLTGALLTERSPSRGDIPPGQVSAPLIRY